MSTFSMQSLDYDPLNVVRQNMPDRMPLRLYGRAARCVDHSIMAMSALFHAARDGAITFPAGTLGDPAEIFEKQLLEACERADALEEYPQMALAANSSVIVWGAQLEQGSFPNSYIPTAGSTVARAQDLFTVPTSAAGANGAWYTAGQGTLLANAVLPFVDSAHYPGLASINDNSGNNSVDLYVNGPNMYKTATIFYQSNTAEMATAQISIRRAIWRR